MDKETKFQHDLKKELEEKFPGCIILKNDPTDIQGIPDLTVLYNDKWVMLECKRSINEPHRPNQDYYVDKTNGMSYAHFIYPENKEEVLNEVQRALQSSRKTRISRRK
jgi:hypothetical protein